MTYEGTNILASSRLYLDLHCTGCIFTGFPRRTLKVLRGVQMPTQIRFKDDSGRIRRCTARCYRPSRIKGLCSCICGGRNHGVGEPQAIINTRAAGGEVKIVQPKPPKRERLGQLAFPTADVEEISVRGHAEGHQAQQNVVPAPLAYSGSQSNYTHDRQ